MGQIRKQEKLLNMIADVESDMRLLVDKMGIAFPPGQEEMKARFGENAPVLGQARMPIESVEKKAWDVTSKCDSLMTCICSCGVAGFTQESMELENDCMYIKTKNNIDDSDMKIPYGEMDSVDMTKSCCCCFTVNEQSPGWGCDKTKVMAIREDLEERKQKRGNIAHLKQLRGMQATAVGLDVMAELVLQKEGMQYPPSPQVMDQIFGGQKPRALTHTQSPNIEPDKEFGSKVYSVTNLPSAIIRCLCCPCAGWTTETLELLPDEIVTVKDNFCSTTTSRTPYGNMGAVETETFCCCCTMLPDIAVPGCGCSEALVNEIAGELQERKVKRGNIAQMKQQENIIIEVLNLEAKVDMLRHKHGIQYPPSPEVMAELFTPSSAPESIGKAQQ